MKQLTCFLLLLTVSLHLLAQKESPVANSLRKEDYPNKTNNQDIQSVEFKLVKTDYLSKSKKQRTAGWILTGTGAAMTFAWIILEMADVVEEAALTFPAVMFGAEPPDTHSKNRSALLITGTAMMLTGTTFLVISRINKKKALSMSFINETSQQLRYNTVMNTSVPSFRLRLQF